MKYRFVVSALLAIMILNAHADNWMGRLPDSQYVATVSIPGSHDSATGSGWTSALGETYSTTQDLTIGEMWNIGVRAFDFRPAMYEGYMNLNHGITATKLHFDDVLIQLRDSLIANPSEFVIIHLLHASDGDNVSDDYGTRLHELFDADNIKDFLVNFKYNMTVGEMRGKILILSRDSYSNPVGGIFQNWTGNADWASQQNGRITGRSGSGSCVMQDYSETWQDGAMDTKLAAMTQLFDYSVWHRTSSPSDIKWIFNFASAYSKVMSIFSYNISLSDGYRDNAAHTNPLVVDYLHKQSGPAGIVMMDYVGVASSNGYAVRGDEAVKAIIENNFREHSNKYVLQEIPLEWLHRGTPSMADFNNDNRPDIYYGGEQYDWKVKGMINVQNSDGSFTTSTSTSEADNLAYGLPPSVYGYSRWIDFDNDGCLDCFLTTRSDNDYQPGDQTWLFHNGGSDDDYRFSKVNDTPFLCGYNEHADSYNAVNNSSVSFADYDRDGFVDVVQQSYTANGREAMLFHNNGDGTFSRALELVNTSHGSVTFGDLDNDGWPDIVLTGWEDGNHFCEFYIYRNNGDGTFETNRMTDSDFIGLCNSDVCLSDLNGDGLLDIIACGNNGGARTDIYLNQGDFRFTRMENHGIIGIDEATIHAVDINYDGRPDLIVSGNSGIQESDAEDAEGKGIRIYLQKENGSFELMPGTGLPPFGQGGFAIGDISRRNTMDMVVVGNERAEIYQLFETPPVKPGRPTGVTASVEDRTITVTWNDAKETGIDSQRLSYNIYVKNSDTDETYAIIPAYILTGRLRTIQDMQNTIRGVNAYSVTPPTGTNFIIGVQTVDPSFQTSTFARVEVTIKEYSPFDVNEDGVVDINDVVAVINVIAGVQSWKKADVNADEEVNINDVVAIVNAMSQN